MPFLFKYTFFKLFATKATMKFHLKDISTILNKSENLYFSDNDNKHITGEQAYLFPTVLNKKSTAVWEAIWNQPDGDKRVLYVVIK